MNNPTVRYMCSTGRTPSSSQRAHLSFDLEDGRCLRFERKAWVSVCLQMRPPLVRLASKRFFRARSRPGPTYGRASPTTQAAFFVTTQEAKDSRVQDENTCIERSLMSWADDGSSGRSRMMRKSHVRFPEKGVATYWSFDQPPPVNSALGPPLTLPLL